MNAVVKPQMKQVAYWPDGYWDMDIEAATDADTFGVFGDLTHSIVEVDAELSGADVDLIVQELVKEQCQVTNSGTVSETVDEAL